MTYSEGQRRRQYPEPDPECDPFLGVENPPPTVEVDQEEPLELKMPDGTITYLYKDGTIAEWYPRGP